MAGNSLGSFTITGRVENRDFQNTTSVTSEKALIADVTVPAANPGTLTTRTDDNTGVATLAAGHTIATAMVVDVYWAAGERRGMTVGAVATNVVPLDGGTGDVLPAATTALTVIEPLEVELEFDGDDVKSLSLSAAARGFIDVADVSASVLERPFAAAGAWVWFEGNPDAIANPLAGEAVTRVLLSHAEAVPRVMRAVVQV